MDTGANLWYELLTKVISGGAAAVPVWWFLGKPWGELLSQKIAVLLAGLSIGPRETKRIIAVVLSTALSLGIYMLAVAFGYRDMPGTPEQWINLILFLGGLSFTANQALHGRELDR